MITIKPLNLTKHSSDYGVASSPPNQFFQGVQIVEGYNWDTTTKKFVGNGSWKWCTFEQQQGEQELVFSGFNSYEEAEKNLQDYYQNWVLSLIY